MEVKCKSGEETPEESENDNNPQVKYNDDGKYQQGHDDEDKNKAKGEYHQEFNKDGKYQQENHEQQAEYNQEYW